MNKKKKKNKSSFIDPTHFYFICHLSILDVIDIKLLKEIKISARWTIIKILNKLVKVMSKRVYQAKRDFFFFFNNWIQNQNEK